VAQDPDHPIDELIPTLAFRHSAGRLSRVDVIDLDVLRRRRMDHSIYSPVRLNFHLLLFITHGVGAHEADFERIELRAGDVLLVRPEQVHAFVPGATHRALLLMFTPETLLRAHIPQPVRWREQPVIRPAPEDFRLLVQLLRLQKTLDADAVDIQAQTVAPYVLGTLLAGLADVVTARRRPADVTALRYAALIENFEDLLDGNYRAARSPAWYAAELGTTPRTLARACRRVRDGSPKRLIDLRVILEAKRQLATSADTVESIGYGLGFSEPTNFVKFFKRLTGSTPDAFRQSPSA
ncbi:MAG: helix-turn-helix transcriptional regulator, partial [Acidobacteriota bacterium]